ncbi:MAG TPA: hypothetical protein PKO33_12920 [Pyrinomonadaceae bacterium]|nr:hypothetical protein [Pyrinomonadaceae bacterium]
MDVYHKVLAKLLESTGGRESESVDLRELVKKEGFLPSYPDIFQHLSRQSWIAETPRADVVRITHWGVTEAKKTASGVVDPTAEIRREASRVVSEARDLITALEEFGKDPSKDGISKLEKAADAISGGIRKLKESV